MKEPGAGTRVQTTYLGLQCWQPTMFTATVRTYSRVALPAARVPECERCSAPASQGGQLRPHGPGSSPPLGAAEHRPVWRRPGKRDADGPRHRGSLYTSAHHVSHGHARYCIITSYTRVFS